MADAVKHQAKLGAAPARAFGVRPAGINGFNHERDPASNIPGQPQKMPASAVGRQIGPEIEHSLVVRVGGRVVADLLVGVSEEAVGVLGVWVERQRLPGPGFAPFELVPVACDPRHAVERRNTGVVPRQRCLVVGFGEAVVAQVGGFPRFLHERIAEIGPGFRIARRLLGRQRVFRDCLVQLRHFGGRRVCGRQGNRNSGGGRDWMHWPVQGPRPCRQAEREGAEGKKQFHVAFAFTLGFAGAADAARGWEPSCFSVPAAIWASRRLKYGFRLRA